jgi:hypothetical protein
MGRWYRSHLVNNNKPVKKIFISPSIEEVQSRKKDTKWKRKHGLLHKYLGVYGRFIFG